MSTLLLLLGSLEGLSLSVELLDKGAEYARGEEVWLRAVFVNEGDTPLALVGLMKETVFPECYTQGRLFLTPRILGPDGEPLKIEVTLIQCGEFIPFDSVGYYEELCGGFELNPHDTAVFYVTLNTTFNDGGFMLTKPGTYRITEVRYDANYDAPVGAWMKRFGRTKCPAEDTLVVRPDLEFTVVEPDSAEYAMAKRVLFPGVKGQKARSARERALVAFERAYPRSRYLPFFYRHIKYPFRDYEESPSNLVQFATKFPERFAVMYLRRGLFPRFATSAKQEPRILNALKRVRSSSAPVQDLLRAYEAAIGGK